jgi:hypothetical protein
MVDGGWWIKDRRVGRRCVFSWACRGREALATAQADGQRTWTRQGVEVQSFVGGESRVHGSFTAASQSSANHQSRALPRRGLMYPHIEPCRGAVLAVPWVTSMASNH